MHPLGASKGQNLRRAHARLQGDSGDPGQHRVAVLPEHDEQALLLVGAQAPDTPLPGAGFADVLNGVLSQPQAPFLDSHGVEVAEQGELQAHGIGTDRLATMTNAVQAGVTEIGDQLRRQSRKGVLAQVLNQRVGLVAFALLGAGLLGVSNVDQVALKRGFERHALRGTALDIDATHHFIFGTARPVLSVTFGTEGLGGVGQPVLRMTAFQLPAGVLTMVAMKVSRGLKDRHYTETVPLDYGTHHRKFLSS